MLVQEVQAASNAPREDDRTEEPDDNGEPAVKALDKKEATVPKGPTIAAGETGDFFNKDYILGSRAEVVNILPRVAQGANSLHTWRC